MITIPNDKEKCVEKTQKFIWLLKKTTYQETQYTSIGRMSTIVDRSLIKINIEISDDINFI
ncbi:hypothetical protein ACI65C_012515 [Semiaphis heraclei]